VARELREAFNPAQPRDRYGRWRPTRSTYLNKEREAYKRAVAKVAERGGLALERHKAERAAKEAAMTPEERERRKRAKDYARELTQLARRSGAPMPVLMQQSNRALVAWQAALDAHDNGNEEQARRHAQTALRLEEVWKPELHPRTRLGRWRQKFLEAEQKAKLRAKGVKTRPLVSAYEMPVGQQLLHGEPLEEAAAMVEFNPRRHPRDRMGRFREVLGSLQANQSVKLPGGTFVTKRVEQGRAGELVHFEVKKPDVKRAFLRSNAPAAAEKAAEAEPELKRGGAAPEPEAGTPEFAAAQERTRQRREERYGPEAGAPPPSRAPGPGVVGVSPTGTLWRYKDARGVEHEGRVERTVDKGGTDVTYYFRDKDTNELSLVSGSRLKDAKVIGREPSPLSSSSRERGLAQVEAERRSGKVRPRIRAEDMAAAELGEPVEGRKPEAPSAEQLSGQDISSLSQIIRRDWAKVNFAAVPYLDAMRSLSSVEDRYGQDPGREIVLRFLGNAGSWRGPVAKAVKAELRRRLKESADQPNRYHEARRRLILESRERPTVAPTGA
jgi:hypothetical protein